MRDLRLYAVCAFPPVNFNLSKNISRHVPPLACLVPGVKAIPHVCSEILAMRARTTRFQSPLGTAPSRPIRSFCK